MLLRLMGEPDHPISIVGRGTNVSPFTALGFTHRAGDRGRPTYPAYQAHLAYPA